MHENIAENMFGRKVIQTNSRKFSRKRYVTNVIDILRKHIKCAGDSVFCIYWERSGRKKDRLAIITFSEPPSQKMQMKSYVQETRVMWIWTWCRCQKRLNNEAFLGFMQLYSDKHVTSLKQTGVPAYPLFINHINFSYEGWKKDF